MKIRQNKEGGFFAEGLTQKKVDNLKEVFKLFEKAQSRRRSAKTGMNEESSRSHLIMTLTIT